MFTEVLTEYELWNDGAYPYDRASCRSCLTFHAHGRCHLPEHSEFAVIARDSGFALPGTQGGRLEVGWLRTFLIGRKLLRLRKQALELRGVFDDFYRKPKPAEVQAPAIETVER
jgi:hypothetical protein